MAGPGAGAQEVSLTLHPDRVLNRIDEKVYGHFLEHIYHSCNGGLWGELIWDRSFEGGGTGVVWQRQDGLVEQRGGASNVRLVFGEPGWTDYEFNVEARKTGGSEGFLILLRVLNEQAFYWANLGGWGNVGHALERGLRGQDRWGSVTARRNGRIEQDRWYCIRARCEGPRIQVWLDGESVIDYTDDGRGPRRGRAGVGTWSTQAQFRNFRVTSLEGKTLYDDLPPLPAVEESRIPGWIPIGSTEVFTTSRNPLNGALCKGITQDAGFGGIAQRPLRVHAGETYRGSLWARGTAPGGLVVQLLAGDRILDRQDLPAPSGDWQEYAIELKPLASSNTATLQIGVEGRAAFALDQVSLMPESWRRAGGFRPDLLGAIADLKPPVIRWPGGCFASPYRWKDGIGPQHRRGPHPTTLWDDKEVNSFGTDEFIAMCRRVGAEPLIVVNIGTPQWNREVLDNDFMQEVLDWIEYCNGPADSRWGRVRAANGHPEPYHVKYWEIDNETWHMGAETYAEWVKRFAPAMRRADPSIKLAACGSAGHGDGGNGLAWNRVLIEQCADKIDYLSIHHYASPDRFAEDPLDYEAFFRKTGDLIAASRNSDLKLYVSEWNAQSTDWRTGLYCGGLLNAFERCGDILEIGGPALFLRHVSASGWDNAFVNFDRRRWFPAPNYVVMKLWRDHYSPYRIDLEGDTAGLNLLATRAEDGRTITIKAVNPTERAVHVKADVNASVINTASMRIVAPGRLQARNTLDAPDAVTPEPGDVAIEGHIVRFTLPPLACGVVTIHPARAFTESVAAAAPIYAGFTEVADVTVETAVGHLPRLPVSIAGFNGKGLEGPRVRVIWPAPTDNRQVQQVGTYVINGTVPGTGFAPKATVTVKAVAGKESHPQMDLVPFPLGQVVLNQDDLGRDTPFIKNRDKFILTLARTDPNRFLYNFRDAFGQPQPEGVSPLRGWDSQTTRLRGHASGHYLTALAQAYAGTTYDQDLQAVFLDKMNTMIDVLYELSKKSGRPAEPGGPYNADPARVPPGPGKSDYDSDLSREGIRTDYWNWGEGFISGYPPDQFIMLEQGATYGGRNHQIWAPYYTLHKILAGLMDCYEVGSNPKALDIASGMGTWVFKRLKALPAETRIEMWNHYIAGEYGGMNEAMARLHQLTGDERFLACARLFDNIDFFFGNADHDHGLACNVDTLRGKHANQHIPQITGALETYRGARDMSYYRVADNFWHLCTHGYMYSIGGVAGARDPNNAECFTAQPDSLFANGFSEGGQNETCATYNLLKLSRRLFLFDPDAKFMDYYEQALYNHILASVAEDNPGNTYHVPLNPGARKRFGNARMDGFTCCNGTALESHTKLQDSIYFKSRDNQALYVNLYIPSTLTWPQRQLKLQQRTRFPYADTTTLTLTGAGTFDIRVRVPNWATHGFSVNINGQAQALKAVPGTYLRLHRTWQDGDTIELKMPFGFHLRRLMDQPHIASLFYGPVLLAVEEPESLTAWRKVTFNGADLGRSITGDPGTLRFSTNGMKLRPFYETYGRHSVYLDVTLE
jgi:alpha-L-arabinofuranosidase/DUF1680 family protein